MWVKEVKSRIRSAQIKAALSVNKEMIRLYWELGKTITEKQAAHAWGSKYVEQLAADLKKGFPGLKGFSKRNLMYMRQFYQYYRPLGEIVPQVVAQIPWGHNRLIINKVDGLEAAQFYLQETVENGWSRNVLAMQIDSRLHKRKGSAIHNFSATLPPRESDLIAQTIKNPYIFDFFDAEGAIRERDIEKQLTKHMTRFLLELGRGFAFIGEQYKIITNGQEFYIDLLFYHYTLRSFIVIELKTGEFKPEHAGKLNFYLSVIDEQIKQETDQPSIGIILCRTKNKVVAEYALRGLRKPIGISEYRLQSALPSVEELEAELSSGFEQKPLPA